MYKVSIPQIANPHAHIVQQAIGHGHGNGQAEHRVHEADGIDTAVMPEHLAEKQSSGQGKGRQDRTRQVSGSKQRGRDPNCRRTPKQFFATREEKRLQHKFLNQRPGHVLPRQVKRRPRRICRNLAASPAHHEDQKNSGGKANRQHHAGSKTGWQTEAHAPERGPVDQHENKNRDGRNERPLVPERQPRRPQCALHENIGNNQLEPGKVAAVGERNLQRS